MKLAPYIGDGNLEPGFATLIKSNSLKLAPYIGDGNFTGNPGTAKTTVAFETSPVYRGRKRFFISHNEFLSYIV